MSARFPIGIDDFRQLRERGLVLELKVARPPKRTLDQALGEGLSIRSRDYAAELRAAGASPVHAFAVAFDGKVVRVRGRRTARSDGQHDASCDEWVGPERIRAR